VQREIRQPKGYHLQWRSKSYGKRIATTAQRAKNVALSQHTSSPIRGIKGERAVTEHESENEEGKKTRNPL